MAHRAIPADTDPGAFDVLVACWQAMSVAERVALVEQMHLDLELLALADEAYRHLLSG